MRTAVFLILMFSFLSITGCGSSEAPTAAVKGTVTVDGKALPKGDIYFSALKPGGVPESLKISDGKFSGQILVGNRKVQISAYRKAPRPTSFTGDSDPMENYISAQFNTNSKLEANVTKDGPNNFEFKVKAKKK